MSNESMPYCDWRINVHDCQDSTFFYRLTASFFGIYSLAWIFQFAHILFIVFVKKPSFKALLRGLNLFVVVAWVNSTLLEFWLALLIAGVNPVVMEMVWGFNLPTIPIFLLVFLETLLSTIPELQTIAGEGSTLRKTTVSQRRVFCVSFGLYFFVTNTALFAIETHYARIGDENNRWLLFQIATGIGTLHALIVEIAFLYFGLKFCSLIKIQLAKMSEQIKQKPEVEESIQGVTRLIYSNGFGSFLCVVQYAIFTFYVDLYSNLKFSKAFFVLIAVFVLFLVPFFATVFFMEVRKHYLGISLRKGSNQTSSENELK